MSVSTDINYWTITLKSYVSCFVADLTKQEKYGQEPCECKWMSFVLASDLIQIMQCYTPTEYVSGTTGGLGDNTMPVTEIVLKDNCYTDANEVQVKRLFQIASTIINKKGDC